MNHNHFLMQCSCGKVINQCWCADPDKRVQVIQNGCAACQEEKIGRYGRVIPLEGIAQGLYRFTDCDVDSHWGIYVASLLNCFDNRSMASDEFLQALETEMRECLNHYESKATIVERSETVTRTWKELDGDES